MYQIGLELEVKLKDGVSLDDVIRVIRQNGISLRDERHTHVGTIEYGTRGWKVVYDGTHSHDGRDIYEFVSNPIVGAPNIEDMVNELVPILQKYCDVDRDCGFHIHFDILGKYHFRRRVDTSTPDGKYRAIRNKPCRKFIGELMRNMHYFQPVFDAVVAPSRRANNFCKPIPNVANLGNKNEIEEFAHNKNGWFQEDPTQILPNTDRYGNNRRYHCINLECLKSYGTVEYRQHQGTLNISKILNWMRLTERFTTRAWDRKKAKLDCENFNINIDGLMDFLGFGRCDRSVREYYRKRARAFGYPAIAFNI